MILDDDTADTIATLQAHIVRLCHEHCITCRTDCKRPTQAWAVREFEEIHIVPVRSRLSYATALHEIGHVLGAASDVSAPHGPRSVGVAVGTEARARLDARNGTPSR